MLKTSALLFLLVLLSGCLNSWCSRAICGCWKNASFREVVSVTDTDSNPVSGISLFCESTQKSYGVTDETGTFKARIKGRTSPGCGMMAECAAAVALDPDGNRIAKIEITQFIRGQEIAAGDYKIKVMRNHDN